MRALGMFVGCFAFTLAVGAVTKDAMLAGGAGLGFLIALGRAV